MEAISNPDIEDIVVMSCTQIGKSDSCILNTIGYYADLDPCPILVILPTVDAAEGFSKERLAPMFRDTPALSHLLSDDSRDSSNTLRNKTIPGGTISLAGANSPSSLAMRPIRIFLADEVDKYPASAGREGDPLTLGGRRTQTFRGNRKRVYTSTPTVKGRSRIAEMYQASNMQRYHVPCPHCGALQHLVWEEKDRQGEQKPGGVKWRSTSLSEPVVAAWGVPEESRNSRHYPETAVYQCRECENVWDDGMRIAAIAVGEWIPQKPEVPVFGFHLSELLSGWSSLEEMVRYFVQAKEMPETFKTFVNTCLGEVWEESGEVIEAEDLASQQDRSQDDPIPEEVHVITVGADVQKNRIELEFVGWSDRQESWSLGYHVLWGELTKGTKLRDEFLDLVTSKRWRHPSGKVLKVAQGCIDSGAFTQDVYKLCATRTARAARIVPIKGRGGDKLPIIVAQTKARLAGSNTPRGAPFVWLYTLGVDGIKDVLFSRLEVEEAGPGYCHFPFEYEQDYFEQLTAEKAVTRFVSGRPVRVYVLEDGKRNEACDCRVYNIGALEILQPNWARLAERLRVEQKEEPKAPKPNPAVRKRRGNRQRGGFVNRW